MSRLSKLDQVLLAEAYSAQLFEESAQYLTIGELQARIPTMTIEEAQIIEELFGKFGDKLAQAASGVGALKNVAGNALKQTVGGAINKAKQVGAGAMEAGKQAVGNVKDVISTGAVEREAQQSISKASELINQVSALVSKAQQQKLIKSQKPVTDMSLSEIMSELKTAQQSAQTFKNNAANAGFTGGMGKAFQKGAQSVTPSQQGPSGNPVRRTA
jgi:hypothetical protein